MNRILKLALLLTPFAVAIVGCNSENPEPYYYTYGTFYYATTPQDSFFIELDNNYILYPASIGDIDTKVTDSSRVLAMYYIESKTDSTIHAKNVIVEHVLSKDIIQLTYENQDSVGSDKVKLSDGSIWVSKNHLNIIFGFYGGKKNHSINLAKPIGRQYTETGRQILWLKHNRNKDPEFEYFKAIVSFDMRSLYKPEMDSINFVLMADTDDAEAFSWEGTYYFNDKKTAKSMPYGMMQKSRWVE